MTVMNRRMFRKKGGGATGIMASGPELIKAQQGVFMGPGNPTQTNQIVRVPPNVQSRSNIPIQSLNTYTPGISSSTLYKTPNFIPSGGSFGKDILNFLSKTPGFLSSPAYVLKGTLESQDQRKDQIAEDIAKRENVLAREKKISPASQAAFAGASGSEVIEEGAELGSQPGFISDTTAKAKQLYKEGSEIVNNVLTQGSDLYSDYKEQGSNLVNKGLNFFKNIDLSSVKDGLSSLRDGYGASSKDKEIFNMSTKNIKKGFAAPVYEDRIMKMAKEKGIDVSKTDLSGAKSSSLIEKRNEEAFAFFDNAYKYGKKIFEDTINYIFQDEEDKLKKEEKATTVDKKDKSTVKPKIIKPKDTLTFEEKIQKQDADSPGALKNQTDDIKHVINLQKKREEIVKKNIGGEKTAELYDENSKIIENLVRTDKAKLGDALGFKNFEGMSLADRKKAYTSILTGLTGTSPDIKTDKDFNLIMTGLLIASGDSPDALTNISRGLAQGLKMFGDSLDERRKEKRDIQLAAAKLAITAEESAKERVFKADEARLTRTTSVLNTLIQQAGKDQKKFGQNLTNTVAANIKDWMTEEEYSIFKTSSGAEKAQAIQDKVMQVYYASPFRNQAPTFDVAAILKATETGKITNITKPKPAIDLTTQ